MREQGTKPDPQGAPLMRKSAPGELVYKTHAEAEPAAPAARDPWNEWLQAALDQYDLVVGEAVGLILNDERVQQQQEREKELEPIKRELAELRGQVSALLALLQGKAADVLPLRKVP
jgi:hypothetical protein